MGQMWCMSSAWHFAPRSKCQGQGLTAGVSEMDRTRKNGREVCVCMCVCMLACVICVSFVCLCIWGLCVYGLCAYMWGECKVPIHQRSRVLPSLQLALKGLEWARYLLLGPLIIDEVGVGQVQLSVQAAVPVCSPSTPALPTAVPEQGLQRDQTSVSVAEGAGICEPDCEHPEGGNSHCRLLPISGPIKHSRNTKNESLISY